MKKAIFTVIIAALATVFLLAPALAAGETEILLDSLPENAREHMEDADVTLLIDIDGILKNIFKTVEEKVSDLMEDAAKDAVAILLAAILCALAHSVYAKKDAETDFISLAGIAVIGAIAVSGIGSLIGTASETVDELNVFSNALIPTLTASSAAGGAVSSSAAKYAATMLFTGIASAVGKNVIFPLIYVYLAVSAGAAAFNGGLDGAAKLIKNIITFLMSAMAIAFTLYISLTGILAESADATAVKLTKAAVSGVLPVVGGIISDAAEVVVTGAGALKNGISVFGMLAVCAVCTLPFLKLLIHMLLYKAAAMLSEVVTTPPIAKFINSIGTALTLSLGIVGTSAVMLFVSIVSFMKTVI